MEAMIKSVAIFTILCEMLIFILPNQTYEKYFRFLINLLLMLFLLESVTDWLSIEGKTGILSRVNELEQELEVSVEQKMSDYSYDYKVTSVFAEDFIKHPEDASAYETTRESGEVSGKEKE